MLLNASTESRFAPGGIVDICAGAYRRSHLFYACELERGGMQPAWVPHLVRVCARPGLTQDGLAPATRTDQSTVARMIGRLVAAGFVARRGNEHDGRSFRVYPTEKGLRLYPEIIAIKRQWHDRPVSRLTDAEREMFRLLLGKIHAGMVADSTGTDGVDGKECCT